MTDADHNLPVLLVAADQGERQVLAGTLLHQGQSVDTAPDHLSALELMERKTYKLILAETRPPRLDGMKFLAEALRRSGKTQVVLFSSGVDLKEAVAAVRAGALDYLAKPLDGETVEAVLGRLAELNRAAARLKAAEVGNNGLIRPIVFASAGMAQVMDMAKAVARSKATVLISGESGTGKELLARFIHGHSDRTQGPFVALNCAALPENLLESELFGHEKGAFTGAINRKPGKFELAHEGTIFLDEVSELAFSLQAKLLRVLQENEIDRVGGRAPVPVDVRVVASTNRSLEEEVDKGNFREDLFYRLNVIPLRLPPLRERTEDLKPLAEHFLAKYSAQCRKTGISFAKETLERFTGHNWRGNVRELQNVIERAVLLAKGSQIRPEDLLLGLKPNQGSVKPQAVSFEPGRVVPLSDLERSAIQGALAQCQGNRTHAAKLLGISVRTLRNKLNEYKQQAASQGQELAFGA